MVPHRWRQGLKRKLFAVHDMRTRLQNLARAGFVPTGAIDGGAYHGEWTRDLWSVWPECPVLMVEPQPNCTTALGEFARRVKGSKVISAALSSQIGPAHFHLSESGSAICDKTFGSASITIQKTTIQNLLKENTDFHPNFIKLDLQGHEIEALEGAKDLKVFELIVLEISILRIGDVPIFSEVDRYLEERDFRLYDIIPQYFRPRDGALWQVDGFYVNRGSSLIESREWA
jgi:FkbM family methyltransferase